jgi:(2R)-3-sulfolactate dehydrogenase (NADP+)
MSDTDRITLDAAEELLGRVFRAVGVPEAAARSVAHALVAAEAEGQAGHGFSRVEDYVAQVRAGKIRAEAQVTTRLTSDTGLLVDAGFGFAYPALDRAIADGAPLARARGSATMAITRSHHCGALSVQVERLAREGLVAMMFANAPAAIAPWGGATPVFGTNPIAFAAPRDTGDPLVIDLSLSRVARGKVMHAKKSGTTIPEGWALDREGRPTTDPEAALQGSMIPIGGAKGTSLALMVEIFAAVMTGSTLSAESSSFFNADGPPPGVGQFLIALAPPDPVAFGARLETLLALVAGVEGARLPGARRLQARRRAEAEGIDVPRRYLDAARALAGDADRT